MLNLQLRDEFKGERLKGTTIDFSADKPTSALQKTAAEFLSITYRLSARRRRGVYQPWRQAVRVG